MEIGAGCRRTGRRAAAPRAVAPSRRSSRARARADAIAHLHPFVLRLDDAPATRPPRADAQLARGDGRPAVRRPGHRQGLALAWPACRRRSARRAVEPLRPGRDRRRRAAARGRRRGDLRQDRDARVLLRRHDPRARTTRTTRRGRPAARPAARRSRSPPAPARSRSAATAAARSGSRPRSAASSASSRRSAPCRASRPPQGWKTLVAYGPLARIVADARLMFAALAGRDPYDRHSRDVDLGGRPRCAFAGLRRPLGTLDDDVRERFRRRLRAARTSTLATRPTSRPSAATWSTIATAEARWAEAEPFEQRPSARPVRPRVPGRRRRGHDRRLRPRPGRARAHPPRLRASCSSAPACC